MKILNYLKGVAREFGLVKWPTKKTTWIFTLAVLAISIFFGIYIGLFDVLFAKMLNIFLTLRDGGSESAVINTVTDAAKSIDITGATDGLKVEVNSEDAAKVIDSVKTGVEIKK